jgi:C-terminal processing protease CtpA/Prc
MTDVAERFGTLLLIHSMLPPYTVRVASAGGVAKDMTLQGVRATPEADDLFTYRRLEPAIGHMNFLSMSGDSGNFKKDIAAMFRQVKDDSVETLLVDLRQNGGGYDALGEELLRYINQKPYRGWSGGELKRSAELRSLDKAYYRVPFRWLPLYFFYSQDRMLHLGPKGSLAAWPQQPVRLREKAEPFFDGPVCVLIGPYTFSAAVVFADAVKTFRLATLVGEETGGRPNFFGETYDFRLPRSGLLASVSTARWVRANADSADMRGVIPDIVVKTTAADIRAGRDPVLERARNCPRTMD